MYIISNYKMGFSIINYSYYDNKLVILSSKLPYTCNILISYILRLLLLIRVHLGASRSGKGARDTRRATRLSHFTVIA